MESFQKRERERKQREKRRKKQERKLERAQDKDPSDLPPGQFLHVEGDDGSSSWEAKDASETGSGPAA